MEFSAKSDVSSSVLRQKLSLKSTDTLRLLNKANLGGKDIIYLTWFLADQKKSFVGYVEINSQSHLNQLKIVYQHVGSIHLSNVSMSKSQKLLTLNVQDADSLLHITWLIELESRQRRVFQLGQESNNTQQSYFLNGSTASQIGSSSNECKLLLISQTEFVEVYQLYVNQSGGNSWQLQGQPQRVKSVCCDHMWSYYDEVFGALFVLQRDGKDKTCVKLKSFNISDRDDFKASPLLGIETMLPSQIPMNDTDFQVVVRFNRDLFDGSDQLILLYQSDDGLDINCAIWRAPFEADNPSAIRCRGNDDSDSVTVSMAFYRVQISAKLEDCIYFNQNSTFFIVCSEYLLYIQRSFLSWYINRLSLKFICSHDNVDTTQIFDKKERQVPIYSVMYDLKQDPSMLVDSLKSISVEFQASYLSLALQLAQYEQSQLLQILKDCIFQRDQLDLSNLLPALVSKMLQFELEKQDFMDCSVQAQVSNYRKLPDFVQYMDVLQNACIIKAISKSNMVYNVDIRTQQLDFPLQWFLQESRQMYRKYEIGMLSKCLKQRDDLQLFKRQRLKPVNVPQKGMLGMLKSLLTNSSSQSAKSSPRKPSNVIPEAIQECQSSFSNLWETKYKEFLQDIFQESQPLSVQASENVQSIDLFSFKNYATPRAIASPLVLSRTASEDPQISLNQPSKLQIFFNCHQRLMNSVFRIVEDLCTFKALNDFVGCQCWFCAAYASKDVNSKRPTSAAKTSSLPSSVSFRHGYVKQVLNINTGGEGEMSSKVDANYCSQLEQQFDLLFQIKCCFDELGGYAPSAFNFKFALTALHQLSRGDFLQYLADGILQATDQFVNYVCSQMKFAEVDEDLNYLLCLIDQVDNLDRRRNLLLSIPSLKWIVNQYPVTFDMSSGSQNRGSRQTSDRMGEGERDSGEFNNALSPSLSATFSDPRRRSLLQSRISSSVAVTSSSLTISPTLGRSNSTKEQNKLVLDTFQHGLLPFDLVSTKRGFM
ncbi:hypothetical protein MIR68_005837 [Amoeboaphelidium protococcarum]|nr:hypothetical protein MIR68_005837 [Amoeboaphelidium protococcarum]